MRIHAEPSSLKQSFGVNKYDNIDIFTGGAKHTFIFQKRGEKRKFV